jgi:hypothetical protein
LPLSLALGHLKALREFRDSEAYPAFQAIVQRLAELRAMRLLKPGTAEEHNFDRGALYAFRACYDVVDTLVQSVERMEAHERESRRNGDGADDSPTTRLWGNANFTDYWQR